MTPEQAKQFELAGRMCGVKFDEYQWKQYLTFARLYRHYVDNGCLDKFSLGNAAIIESRTEKDLDSIEPKEKKDASM